MPNLQNLLKRRPVVEELDPEVHARLRARLASLHEPYATLSEHEVEDSPVPDTSEEDAAPPLSAAVVASIFVLPAPQPEPPAVEEAERLPDGLDADDWDAEPAAGDQPETSLEEPPAPPILAVATPEIEVPVPTSTEIDGALERPRPSRAPRPAARTTPTPARKPRAIRALVACPYCAEPLKVPPVASGKCPRCRLRIVVRRVGERSIYLTEAALPVFLAERRRSAHSGRWTRERDRWLELAKASGAEPQSVARIMRQVVSEEAVASARGLYMSTVERAAREARRARRWEDAGTLRYEQALALYRIARSTRPVPAEILAVHRDGLASNLRGIAEIAKSAELRGGTCCDVCRADDGRTVRISEELRTPSLPHAACEKGLCRCRWYLAARDRAILTDLLKRGTRTARQVRSPQGS